jgi:Domain of unknown function (DUF4382)
MKKTNSMKLVASAIVAGMLMFAACKKDKAGSGTARTTFKVTDAPIDDASVTAAFITIADVKLDGQSINGFTKTTVDLNALQNGTTQTIGEFDLEGKTYNSITFVLDYENDASGNAPGSYIVTTGGTKHKLQSTASAITVSKNISLQGNASNSIVADFDLRKIIIHQSGSAADQYDFATAAELESSIRVVTENNTGTISGTLTDNISGSGKVVAYAYKKGTFNRSAEMQPQGTSGVYFKNAVSSSFVSNSGAYQLHFLENGEYEVQFASYKDTNSDGVFELSGTLVVTSIGDINLLGLTLGSNTTLTANATATGVLP